MRKRTWEMFDQERNDNSVALLPIGSIEQHGLHAPLDTDLCIAELLAERGSEVENTFLLPSIPVGVSEYHRNFAGSLWVSPEAMKTYVGGIIESLCFQEIRKIIIVNGHGGNREPLKELARYLPLKEDVTIYVWTWFEAIEKKVIEIFGVRPPLHADEAETAMLQALSPESVYVGKLEASTQDPPPGWGVFHEGTMISQLVDEFTETGSTGTPSKTFLENGRIMLDASVANLKELISFLQNKRRPV